MKGGDAGLSTNNQVLKQGYLRNLPKLSEKGFLCIVQSIRQGGELITVKAIRKTGFRVIFSFE